jgi:hypothetical protein
LPSNIGKEDFVMIYCCVDFCPLPTETFAATHGVANAIDVLHLFLGLLADNDIFSISVENKNTHMLLKARLTH